MSSKGSGRARDKRARLATITATLGCIAAALTVLAAIIQLLGH
jgi:hypothetical protein